MTGRNPENIVVKAQRVAEILRTAAIENGAPPPVAASVAMEEAALGSKTDFEERAESADIEE